MVARALVAVIVLLLPIVDISTVHAVGYLSATQRVSEAGTAASPIEATGGFQTSSPRVSADGRYVIYASDATNLVAGDTNGHIDIFVFDRQTHTTTRVSEGGTSGSPVQSNAGSSLPDISADGRYVIFASTATNLVAGDTNGVQDVFVHDRQTHTTTRVSEGGTTASPVQANAANHTPAISADGQYAVYASVATNLVTGDTNSVRDIFVHDRQTHTTTRVSEGGTTASPVQSNNNSFDPDISGNNQFVVFSSFATNIGGATGGNETVFIFDRQTHTTTRVSEGGTTASPVQANDYSYNPGLSADGRYVMFSSDASNLVTGDTNSVTDVFVHDRQTHTTTRVSEGGTTASPVQANDYSNNNRIQSISADGRYVGFDSYATNLTANATDGLSYAYVHDRQTHTTTLVTVADWSGTATAADDESYQAALSADGRYVAFLSYASNLIAGGSSSGVSNIYMARAPGYYDTTANQETGAPNSGDANNDGAADAYQSEVASFSSTVSGEYVTVASGSSCATITSASAAAESTSQQDTSYDYPAGLVSFTSGGCATGGSQVITVYFYGDYDPSTMVLRKFNATSGAYTTVSGAVLSSVTVGGQAAVRAVYTVTDGGSLDQDGVANGVIVDPVGLAGVVATTTSNGSSVAVAAPSSGFKTAGATDYVAVVAGLLIVLSVIRMRYWHGR